MELLWFEKELFQRFPLSILRNSLSVVEVLRNPDFLSHDSRKSTPKAERMTGRGRYNERVRVQRVSMSESKSGDSICRTGRGRNLRQSV